MLYAHELDLKLIEPLIGEMAEAAGLSPYTVWLLFLIGPPGPPKSCTATGAFPRRCSGPPLRT